MQTATFNISMPRELVRRADDVARKQYRSRSELVREALRKYITDAEEIDALFALGHRFGRAAGIKSEEEVARIVEAYRHGK